MRHKKRTDKLGKKAPHRKATLANIVASLIKHERVNTKLRLARSARRYAEKMITLAKKNTLHSRRLAIAFLRPDTDQEKENIRKLFDVLGPRFADRPGGYTRIIKLESRRGDNAPMAILEFVDAKVTFKKRKKSDESDELAIDTEISGDIQSQDDVSSKSTDDNSPENSKNDDAETPTQDVSDSKQDETKADNDQQNSTDKNETNNEKSDSDVNENDSQDADKKGGFFKNIFKGGE